MDGDNGRDLDVECQGDIVEKFSKQGMLMLSLMTSN